MHRIKEPLEILEKGDSLLFRVQREPSRTETLVAAIASGGCAAVVLYRFLPTLWVVAAAALAAAVSWLLARRHRSVTLLVTKFEFQSVGKIGDELGSRRQVCSADIRWLEYQEDRTGPETAGHPEGLYAVLKRRSVCLLPYTSPEEVATIIEHIATNFPGMSSEWKHQSAFDGHFISLNLNKH